MTPGHKGLQQGVNMIPRGGINTPSTPAGEFLNAVAFFVREDKFSSLAEMMFDGVMFREIISIIVFSALPIVPKFF